MLKGISFWSRPWMKQMRRYTWTTIVSVKSESWSTVTNAWIDDDARCKGEVAQMHLHTGILNQSFNGLHETKWMLLMENDSPLLNLPKSRSLSQGSGWTHCTLWCDTSHLLSLCFITQHKSKRSREKFSFDLTTIFVEAIKEIKTKRNTSTF